MLNECLVGVGSISIKIEGVKAHRDIVIGGHKDDGNATNKIRGII